MRKIFVSSLLVFIVIIGNVRADSFEITTKVSEVMGYAMNSNYESDQCVVYFEKSTPTVCKWKTRVVIKTDKGAGDLMCSIAMTALVSDKNIKVASADDTCEFHNSPVARYLSIVK